MPFSLCPLRLELLRAPPSTVIDEKTAPSERPFSFGQRFALFFIAWVGYLAIELICSTLRFEISSEEVDSPDRKYLAAFSGHCSVLAPLCFSCDVLLPRS